MPPDLDDHASPKCVALQQKADDLLSTSRFRYARLVKLHKKTYKEEAVAVFTWMLATYFKLNNTKFDILDNPKKLGQLITKQLLSKDQDKSRLAQRCLLI